LVRRRNASLELTEFIDGGRPEGGAKGWAIEEHHGRQAAYFRVPNLSDPRFTDDESPGYETKTNREPKP